MVCLALEAIALLFAGPSNAPPPADVPSNNVKDGELADDEESDREDLESDQDMAASDLDDMGVEPVEPNPAYQGTPPLPPSNLQKFSLSFMPLPTCHLPAIPQRLPPLYQGVRA